MGSLLARCRIGCQIAMLGLIGIVGVLAIAGLNWWGTDHVNQAYAVMAAARQARDVEVQAQMTLLQARRHEKDFLLRRDDKSITLHAAAVAAAEHALDTMTLRVAGQPELAGLVHQMTLDVQRYAANFDTVVQRAKTIGLNENQGLLGALRTSVHDVEERLKSVNAPAAQIAMLMMRRHEKDFMARLDPQYGAQLKARLPEFVAAIDAAAPPPDVKRDLLAKMSDYQATFGRFMAGTLDELQAVKTLSTVYAELEPRLAEVDQRFTAQADAAQQQGNAIAATTHRNVLLSLAAIIAAVAVLCWIVGRSIARPIIAVTRAMDGLVRGDLTTALPADKRRDEIGTMIHVVGAFRDSLIAAARMQQEQIAAREQGEVDKRAALTAMAERIETEAGAAVAQIGERTTAMTTTADEMRALAGRTGQSAQGAANAAALALGNAQTVASAAGQLTASIREISAQVNQSTVVVSQAVAAGTATRATIEALNERVGRIGAVADIIKDIAGKTNLLALNATIEAARAGEAGKGFAVVASEVKQLASQTAHSTEEIARHLSEVRSATNAAVTAVGRIEATIGEVNAIAGSIAAAVEQQGAATAEIARNVTETASAVNEMSSRNAEVSREAEQAGHYAGEVLDNTMALGSAVHELRQAMIRTVRTSTAEVNRRAFERHNAGMACQVEVAGQAACAAQIGDISEGGARLLGMPHLMTGSAGTLRLDTVNLKLPFVVRGVDADSSRIAFALDAAGGNAVRALLERMSAQRAA